MTPPTDLQAKAPKELREAVCEALERAALDVEYMDGAVDPGAPPSPTAALLRTLKARIEGGEVTHWRTGKKYALVIDMSDEGEAG